MKPKLKPPGTKCLKLECDILLSTSAFKFNLCRYTMGDVGEGGASEGGGSAASDGTPAWARCGAGPGQAPVLSRACRLMSTLVARCWSAAPADRPAARHVVEQLEAVLGAIQHGGGAEGKGKQRGERLGGLGGAWGGVLTDPYISHGGGGGGGGGGDGGSGGGDDGAAAGGGGGGGGGVLERAAHKDKVGGGGGSGQKVLAGPVGCMSEECGAVACPAAGAAPPGGAAALVADLRACAAVGRSQQCPPTPPQCLSTAS